jgi:hypothetical protein
MFCFAGEVLGYLARIAAYNSTGSMGPFLIQAIFLLIPPVLFAASLYMVYSRVVRAVQGESFSLITPRWTTRLFVLGDVICLNIQSTGAGFTPKAHLAKLGDGIIVAGLGIQVLVFAGFMAFCLTFHIRYQAHESDTGRQSRIPWRSCLVMLYTTSMAILVRNIYRMVEYIMGQDGYFMRNEWPTYVFDGTLMLLVMVGFFIWYPNQLQSPLGDTTIELLSDGDSSAERRQVAKR